MPVTPARLIGGGATAVSLGASALLVLGTVTTAGALGPEDGDGVIIATESGENWSFLGVDGPNSLSGSIDLRTVAGLEGVGDIGGEGAFEYAVAAVEYVTDPELVDGMEPDRDYVDLLLNTPVPDSGYACLIVRADVQSGAVVEQASGLIYESNGEDLYLSSEACSGLEYLPGGEASESGAYLVLLPTATVALVDPATLTVESEVDIFGELGEIPVSFQAVAFDIIDDDAVLFLGFEEGVIAVRLVGLDETLVSDEFALDAAVTGLDIDSSGNLWVLAVPDGEGEAPRMVAFDAEDLLDLAFIGPSPIPSPTLTLQPNSTESGDDSGAEEFLSDFALSPTDAIQPAAVADPVFSSQLTLDGSSATLRSITAVPTGSVFSAEAELSATGADDRTVLSIGIIAGALLIGGIVVTAVGASRRRASRE